MLVADYMNPSRCMYCKLNSTFGTQNMLCQYLSDERVNRQCTVATQKLPSKPEILDWGEGLLL
jgi:hypothetical protein